MEITNVNEAIQAIKERHPWIGRVLNRLPISYSDTLPNGQGPNHTMATNGKELFINPVFLATLSWYHLMGILVHEAVHVIQRHPLRRGNRIKEIYGIAIDAATNAVVDRLGYQLPSDKIAPVFGQTVEQIYAELVKNMPPPQPGDSPEQGDSSSQSSPDGTGQGTGSPSGDSKPQESGDSGDSEEKSDSEDSGDSDEKSEPQDSAGDAQDGNSKPIPSMPEPGTDVLDYPLEEGETMQDAERAIDSLMAQAAMDLQFAGIGPASSELHIFEPRESDLNWPRELQDYVNLIGGADYSLNPPHNGLMQTGIICNQLNPIGCGNVVLAVDTSGSINVDKLNLALANLMLFIENMDYESVRVIACPSRVTYDRTFYRGETVDLSDMPIGGGTRFMPVFDLVAEGENPDLLIYFTDMCTNDIEDDFDAGYPVVWLVDSEYAIDDQGEWTGHYATPHIGKRIDTNK